jgi:serine/threonine-protein kinase
VAIIAGVCTVLGIFSMSGFFLSVGLSLGIILAIRYSRFTQNQGYDWRDLFRQPRDRLFFDVAAESIDNARALFDRDKRAAMRERLRLSAGQVQPGQVRIAPLPAYQPVPVPVGIPAPFPRDGALAPSQSASPAPVPAMGRGPVAAAPALRDEADGLASTEVLNGVHGGVVRRAATDRAAVRQEVGRLGPADRALLPDVVPTVDALVLRIAALATALHRLDGDLAPDALPELDKRIAGAEAEPAAKPDRERKLALLRRQRATLQDLADRRASLSAQLESAGLVLQNIRFDLLRLRSAGVQSAIDDVTTATQEARVLSREIGHVLNAAEEIKSV